MTAREALRYKALARVYERWADENAAKDEPWTTRNVHLCQSYMCKALDARSAILREYLKKRKER